MVLVQEEGAELARTARRPRPATAGCGCRPSSPWRVSCSRRHAVLVHVAATIATRPGTRAGPPRSANDTQPSLHGQISRCTLFVCRKKAPARWPRLPVIFDIDAGRHVRHHHRLLQRDVDVLALAGALARQERERDADRRLDARRGSATRAASSAAARGRDRRCSAGCRSCAMTVRSEPRQPACGPVWPNGVSEHRIEARVARVQRRPSRGRARRARPARRSRARRRRAPRGAGTDRGRAAASRSSVMPRLDALSASHSERALGIRRRRPRTAAAAAPDRPPGGSTLTTSAPSSPSSMPARKPGSPVRSRTRMPCKVPRMPGARLVAAAARGCQAIAGVGIRSRGRERSSRRPRLYERRGFDTRRLRRIDRSQDAMECPLHFGDRRKERRC